jgi:hypothetical protein
LGAGTLTGGPEGSPLELLLEDELDELLLELELLEELDELLLLDELLDVLLEEVLDVLLDELLELPLPPQAPRITASKVAVPVRITLDNADCLKNGFIFVVLAAVHDSVSVAQIQLIFMCGAARKAACFCSD